MSEGTYWNGTRWVPKSEFRRPAPVIRAKPATTRAKPPRTEPSPPAQENPDGEETDQQ